MIICAAIKVRNPNTNLSTVIPCWRHAKGYEILKDLCPGKFRQRDIEEGFIDSHGDFYDRKEALAVAIEYGQLSASTRWYKEDRNDTELYSEDLY